MKNFLKILGWFISTGIAVAALVISLESNQIAKEAKISSQRPYVAVSIVKSDKNNKNIYAKEKDGGLEFNIIFEFTNNGNSLAKNIHLSDIYNSTLLKDVSNPNVFIIKQTQIKIPETVTLAPRESIKLGVTWIRSNMDRVLIDNTLKEIEQDEYSIPFNLELKYEGDDSFKGSTGLSMEIKPDKTIFNYTAAD